MLSFIKYLKLLKLNIFTKKYFMFFTKPILVSNLIWEMASNEEVK